MHRSLLITVAALTALTGRIEAQGKKSAEPAFQGRPLSSWVADLKARAPYTRNAAAYAIGGMGASAKAAVPALIAVLEDSTEVPAVRFPVCVALREIGPDAKAAVPVLTQTLDDRNDEVAAMARKAIKSITGVDPRPPEN